MCLADFAQNLAFLFAIVPRQVIYRSIICRVGTVLWNIAFYTAKNRFEFLILWRVGIIKSPLLERNISANKGLNNKKSSKI